MTILTDMLGLKEAVTHPVTLACFAGLLAWGMMSLDSRVSGEPKAASTYIKNILLITSIVLGVTYLFVWVRSSGSVDVILSDPDF